jgi:chromate reductase
MERLKLVGISGSIRKSSYNRVVLESIKELFKDSIDIEVIDISNIPLFSEDIENDYIKSVSDLSTSIINSDGVIICSPEYNYSIPGVLKNTIDFISRDKRKPLSNKRVAIISSSTGKLGGSRMQYDLRKVLICLNADVIRKPEIFISEVDTKINDNNKVIDESVLEAITLLVNNLSK